MNVPTSSILNNLPLSSSICPLASYIVLRIKLRLSSFNMSSPISFADSSYDLPDALLYLYIASAKLLLTLSPTLPCPDILSLVTVMKPEKAPYSPNIISDKASRSSLTISNNSSIFLNLEPVVFLTSSSTVIPFLLAISSCNALMALSCGIIPLENAEITLSSELSCCKPSKYDLTDLFNDPS